jgi:hypothetical protein
METKNINLVIVTSVTTPFLPSVFTAKERFDQLTNLTIPSIQKKIPNLHLVVLEGNLLTDSQKAKLKELGVNELLHFNIRNCEKSYGEATLIFSYLKSTFFKNLIKNKNIVTFNKISGRYYLAKDFDFSKISIHKILIKRYDKSSWTDKGICDTRYYRFPFSYFDRYFAGLKKILTDGVFIDLEHSFYYYDIFPVDNIEKVDKIYLEGNQASDGRFVID